MEKILIKNGIAFTMEGVPVENFSEVYSQIETIAKLENSHLQKYSYKDGTYELPDGWDIVRNVCEGCPEFGCRNPENCKQTARLVRKANCKHCGGDGYNVVTISSNPERDKCEYCDGTGKENSAHELPEIQPAITKEIVNRNELFLAMEFGFRQCEKGNNLDYAKIEFSKLLNSK